MKIPFCYTFSFESASSSKQDSTLKETFQIELHREFYEYLKSNFKELTYEFHEKYHTRLLSLILHGKDSVLPHFSMLENEDGRIFYRLVLQKSENTLAQSFREEFFALSTFLHFLRYSYNYLMVTPEQDMKCESQNFVSEIPIYGLVYDFNVEISNSTAKEISEKMKYTPNEIMEKMNEGMMKVFSLVGFPSTLADTIEMSVRADYLHVRIFGDNAGLFLEGFTEGDKTMKIAGKNLDFPLQALALLAGIGSILP